MIDWDEAMPLAGLLGIEGVGAMPEEVHARLAWRDDLCTAGGVMHGGALMALADCAGGVCAYLNLPEGEVRPGQRPSNRARTSSVPFATATSRR